PRTVGMPGQDAGRRLWRPVLVHRAHPAIERPAGCGSPWRIRGASALIATATGRTALANAIPRETRRQGRASDLDCRQSHAGRGRRLRTPYRALRAHARWRTLASL